MSLGTLCVELEPEISDVREKEPEPLPDPGELAQLRASLRAFPLPYPVQIAQELQPISKPTIQALGRNDRCPCGSTKKWKRCCGARKP